MLKQAQARDNMEVEVVDLRRLPLPRAGLHIEVEAGLVSRITIIDETPFADPTVVEGHPGGQAVEKCRPRSLG
jgi:hypothetical protein